jgi:hypothetical protein
VTIGGVEGQPQQAGDAAFFRKSIRRHGRLIYSVGWFVLMWERSRNESRLKSYARAASMGSESCAFRLFSWWMPLDDRSGVAATANGFLPGRGHVGQGIW